MKINYAKLKYYCEIRNTTLTQLAKYLKINDATLNRKMNGSSDFYRHEIIKIKKVLNLSVSEMLEIFFET